MVKLSGKFGKYRKRAFKKRMAKALGRNSKRRRMVTKPAVQRSLGMGLPKKLTVTHKYGESFALTSTLGAFTKYQWSVNSMFDPNTTGTGGQPMYFDQISALYDHYTVIGSKCTITVCPNELTSGGFFAGAYIDDDTNTSNVNGISGLWEQTTGRFRQIAPGQDTSSTWSLKWSAKKTFGGAVLSNNNLQGTPSASPAEMQHFTIGIQGFNAGVDVIVRVTVRIEYICVWAELKDIGRS